MNRKHGYKSHPLYPVWSAMKTRCLNKNHRDYKYYGGRGITVCKDWINSAENFINWALSSGWVPGLQIDRENNDCGYHPDNCRFVTRLVNARNTRVVKNNTSGFRGVSFNKRVGKYIAYIGSGKNLEYLGCFKNIDDAVDKRREAEKRLGFPVQ